MGQLHRFISQVLSIPGFKVAVWFWLRADGVGLLDHNDLFVPPDAALVVRLNRIGRPFCPDCGHRCRKTHEALDCRKWRDLSWGTHHVFVQYAPQRVKCPRCNATPVEWLAHAVWVHDPFHVIQRANKAIDELRREMFFRASPELRAVGRGKRWLVLRAWEKTKPEQRAELRKLFRLNPRLANAYQILEELRMVLKAPDKASMSIGLMHVLLRTERRANKPMRKLHDSLEAHWNAIVALGEHHPPTGRIEALNNNWETLIRRGRGYRDLAYVLLKLRFMIVNPIRDDDGTKRFLALGMMPPACIAA